MTNAYQRLLGLLPAERTLVGRVIAVDEDQGVSTVQYPASTGQVAYGGALRSGGVSRVAGTDVPVGTNAVVYQRQYQGRVQARAPENPIIEIVIGRVVTPP